MTKWKVRKLEDAPAGAIRGWLEDEQGKEAFVLAWPDGETRVHIEKHEVLDPRRRAEVLTAFYDELRRDEE